MCAWVTRTTVVAVTSENENPDLALALEAATFPLVIIGTREHCLPKRKDNLRIVTVDETKLAAFATRHLISCGRFASYGYVHFRENFCRYLSDCREKGFRTELAKSGIAGSIYLSPLTEETPDVSELGHWLKSLPKPAALLVGYDRRAMEVLDACAKNGIRVPDDVRVLGIDNDELVCQQILGLLRDRQENDESRIRFHESACPKKMASHLTSRTECSFPVTSDLPARGLGKLPQIKSKIGFGSETDEDREAAQSRLLPPVSISPARRQRQRFHALS